MAIIQLTTAGAEVALISIATSLLTFAVNKVFINQDELEKVQKRTKEINKNMKQKANTKDETILKKAEEEQKELMELMGKQFKMSMKPMIITLIPILLIFAAIKAKYDNMGAMVTIQGIQLTWFWWYIIVAIITSSILNKTYALIRRYKKTRKEGKQNA